MDVTLSIVVPAYNVMNMLEPCIVSIMEGTYQDFELLLVDDGSTDGTSALCDQLSDRYNRIRVFHTENCGLSMARNLGIEQASGKYVGFVDSDDLITPDMYSVMIAQMSEDTDLVCCRFKKCKREDVAPLEMSGEYSVQTGEGIPNQIVCNYYGAYAWSKLFRKALLDSNNIRFKTGYIMEDLYFMADYLGVCRKAAFLEDMLYYYIDTPGSIMNHFRSGNNVESKYVYIPHAWVYFADAVAPYQRVYAEASMRAAMTYQSVLRKLNLEDAAFTAEAIAYLRKNIHLLLRHRWGFPYFISGMILCASYPLWKKLFRRQ